MPLMAGLRQPAAPSGGGVMDPNAALVEIRELVAAVATATDEEVGAGLGAALAERFNGLDVWLSGGGFKPADWACASR